MSDKRTSRSFFQDNLLPLSLLDSADVPFGIVVLESTQLVITFVNTVVLAMWGRKKGEVLDKPLFTAVPELGETGINEVLQKVIKEGKTIKKSELLRELGVKDKIQTLYIDLVYHPLRNETGKVTGVIVVGVDVTEKVNARKNAEELAKNLEKEKVRMAIAEEAAKIGTFEWDFVTGNSSGTKGFEQLYGLKREKEFLGLQKWREYIHPDDRKKATEAVTQALEKKKELLLEFRVIWPDTSIHYLQSRAKIFREKKKPVRMIGATIDITKVKEAEIRLSESEERFRALIENSSDAINLLDEKGKILFASDSVKKVLGYSPTEVMGGAIFSYTHPEDMEYITKKFTQLVKRPGGFASAEYRVRNKAGEWVWIEATGANYLKKPPINAIVANFRNITKRKQLERQKDEFLGIASHELKTPVTSIKAYGQVLQRVFEKEGNTKAAEQLSKMDAQINKLTNLIGDLLDVTKIQSGKLVMHEEKFAFNELVAEITEELQRTTNKHQLILTLDKNTGIRGDRERIGQVLTNLITNAIKYSPHSEKIIISTKLKKESIMLCVQDFGVGIPEDKKNKVFEQFFRVSSDKHHTFPGLGLGLYISSEIIQREGGRIWVESSVGKGSTFCFSLPLYKRKKKEKRIAE